MCHRSDKLAVLDDGGARHECGQVGTTHFYNFLIVLTLSTLFIRSNRPFISVAESALPFSG